MVSTRRSFRIALVSALLGVLGIATVLYHRSVYEAPDDGGTSLAGLGFFVFAFVCFVTVVEAGFVAALIRLAAPSPWPRRILVVGAAGAGLAALVIAVAQLVAAAGDPTVAGRRLASLTRPLRPVMWAAAAVGLAGTVCGLFAETVVVVREQ